ncbi:hypothetical protein ES708_01538 [subsurface metagenome]
MKCPFLLSLIYQQGGLPDGNEDECKREDCAWWVEASQSCAMEAIPRIIGYLGSELKTIKDEMSHPGIFKG